MSIPNIGGRKMGEAKKLNLSLQEICNIARSLNQNILANRARVKEYRIQTDHYLRQTFNISRREFNFTAKAYGIKYNSISFLYSIPPVISPVNPKNTGNITDSIPSNTASNIVSNTDNKILQKPLKNNEFTNDNTDSLPINLYELSQQFNEIIKLFGKMKEVLEWYEDYKNKKVTGDMEIKLEDNNINGEVITESYKVFKRAAELFSDFAKDRKEPIRDLVSLALIEFAEKYK